MGAKDLNQEAQFLREKLDAYEKRTEDLKTLTALLLGLSTLYAISLGIGSYLGVQDATTRAKDSIDSVDKKRDEAEKNWESRSKKRKRLSAR